jgi:hypothetical protein
MTKTLTALAALAFSLWVGTAAQARGQTKAQYLQDRAEREADAALAAMYEQWFASRSLSEKKAIYDAHQA